MEGAGCRRSKELRIPWGQAMRFVLLAAIIRFNLEGNRGCTAFWRGWSPALPPAEGGKKSGGGEKEKSPGAGCAGAFWFGAGDGNRTHNLSLGS